MREWLRQLPPRTDLEATLRVIRAVHDHLEPAGEGNPLEELEAWLTWLLEDGPWPQECLETLLPPMPELLITERLYLTADQQQLVTQEDPRQAFLYITPGHHLPLTAWVMSALPAHLVRQAEDCWQAHRDACHTILEEVQKIRETLT